MCGVIRFTTGAEASENHKDVKYIYIKRLEALYK